MRCQTQLYLGLWEHETYRFLRAAVDRADWLMDVGAGSGELVLAFLRRRPAGRAWALEPNGAGRAAIARNLALNQDIDRSRLVVLPEFAGAVSRERFIRLDDLTATAQCPGLIKIDVDGAELDVLAGASRLLARADVDVLVETHGIELERACVDLLERSGRRCQIIPNAWWRCVVPEQRPSAHNRWLAATCRR